MKCFRIQSGDIDYEFDLPVKLIKKPLEEMTFLDIQLVIADALEGRQKTLPKDKVGGWGLIGELWINSQKVGLIPMIPYLADAGAKKEVEILEYSLSTSDLGVQVVYGLVLETYNKNSFQLT